jgi:hypothetical protein
MRVLTVQRLWLLPAGGMLAVALAGCSGTTYGTGVSPEKQTLTDVMSIASLGGDDKPNIQYKPRGGIVVPPNNNLPPPMQTASAQNDPNWPKDPDELRRRKKEADALAPSNQPAPNMRLAPGQTSFDVKDGVSTPQSREEGRKAWEALHKGKAGSYDANGNPTRKYLTEPPVVYRAGDPNAPMVEPPKPAKKAWKIWPF